MSIGAIVFDFDGTLVDSNSVKRDAFFELFPNEPEGQSVLRDVLAESPYANRAQIVGQTVHRLGRDPALAQSLVDRYAVLALEAVRQCCEMEGAGALLENLAGQYPLYICSGTPIHPLQELVGLRGWSPYFREVWGHPVTKTKAIRDVLSRENLVPSQVAMVGDGDPDRSAAEEVGTLLFMIDEDTSLLGLPVWLASQQ